MAGRETFAAAKPGPHATLQFTRNRAVRRLFTGGDVGFAESYLAGDWDSPDLAALIELAARNEAALTEALRGFAVVRAWHRVRHLLRPNSRAGSAPQHRATTTTWATTSTGCGSTRR